jgi:uncharacterized protein YbjT (DUF2867 family)
MRAFVTGGSGFVGRALIGALARRGDAARALARSDAAARVVGEVGAEPVRGDLDERRAAVRGGEPLELLAGSQYLLQLHLQNASDTRITRRTIVNLHYAEDPAPLEPAGMFAITTTNIQIPPHTTDHNKTIPRGERQVGRRSR